MGFSSSCGCLLVQPAKTADWPVRTRSVQWFHGSVRADVASHLSFRPEPLPWAQRFLKIGRIAEVEELPEVVRQHSQSDLCARASPSRAHNYLCAHVLAHK
jgi:hypothetical protein